MRIALLLLIPLAMAKPYLLTASEGATLERDPAAVVFVVDDSASMSLGGAYDEALKVVEAEVDRLRPWDRTALVFASSWPSGAPIGEDVPLPELVSEHDDLLDVLQARKPSERGTDLSAALKTAADMLAGSELPAKRIVILTDRQKSGFDRAALPVAGVGYTVLVPDLNVDGRVNYAITSAASTREATPDGLTYRFDVTVLASGNVQKHTQEVQLELDGKIVGSSLVSFEKPGQQVATFKHRFDKKGMHRVTLRLPRRRRHGRRQYLSVGRQSCEQDSCALGQWGSAKRGMAG